VFEALLERLATELAAAGIPYMVIGGQAVLLYGEPRTTKDIDITLGIGVEGYSRVREVSNRLGLRIIPADPEEFVRDKMVLPTVDDKTGIRVDFVFSFTSYEQQAIARAVPVRFGATDVRFATLEDVVVQKVFAGRPRDIDDVRAILQRNPGHDRGYIEKWLVEFDRSLGKKLLSQFRQLADPASPRN
jgi:hypothetical protein